MMADVYLRFAKPLSHDLLFSWHKMVMAGERRIDVIGNYRQHAEPMQVVSNRLDNPRIHFEGPPSVRVKAEMDGFVSWFNNTSPKGKAPLPALTRAGIAHLYFESIHPFEDGNGRIGRALSEKALAQNIGEPSLIALAYTIERHRKRYYDMLEQSNKDNAITDWLVYFANTTRPWKRSKSRSPASNSPSPRPNSMNVSAASSTNDSTRPSPVCSRRVSMDSRAALALTIISELPARPAQRQHETCKTWSQRER
jgi:hypothetical protein